MGSDVRLLLGIRTIVVTTRVAVHSHRRAGDDELARESAQRGTEMLADIGRGLPSDASDRVSRSYREAQRELQGFMALATEPLTRA